MIEYRFANKNDTESIALLHAKSWQKAYRGMFSDYYLDHLVVNDRLSVWAERFKTFENQVVILALDDKKLIGFVCIYPNADENFGSLIDNLHVAENQQGKGIGACLLQKAAEWIKAHTKSPKLYLWVLEKNAKAYNFYLKLNAKNMDQTNFKAPDGNNHIAIRMAWDEFAAL